MKKRAIKFLGILTLVLVGVSIYLFAQNAGNNTTTVKKGLSYYQGKYCEWDDLDCQDCMYVWYHLVKEPDPEKKEAAIAKRVAATKGDFKARLQLLKKNLSQLQSREETEKDAKLRAAILKNLENDQIKRALGEGDRYDIKMLEVFLEEGTLTADAWMRVIRQLRDASYNPGERKIKPPFDQKDEIVGERKIELLWWLAEVIKFRMDKGLFAITTSHGSDIVGQGFNAATYAIYKDCELILIGKEEVKKQEEVPDK